MYLSASIQQGLSHSIRMEQNPKHASIRVCLPPGLSLLPFRHCNEATTEEGYEMVPNGPSRSGAQTRGLPGLLIYEAPRSPAGASGLLMRRKTQTHEGKGSA